MPTISRRELTLAIVWSVFVVSVTCAPYVVAQREANGRYFSGLISAVDDGNVYLQWIRQCQEGNWTLDNQYTAQETRAGPFNIFLFGLGRMARWLGLTPAEVFGVARVVCGCGCLVAFYLLAAAFSPTPAFRWTALMVVSLSSGFGWIVDMLPAGTVPFEPVDYGPRWLYQPEAVTFVSILINPLFAFSLALICLAFFCVLRAIDTHKLRWGVGAGVCSMLLASAHTYDLPVVHLTTGAWLLMAVYMRRVALRRAILIYGVMLVLTLPPACYQAYVMRSDPLFRAKADTPTLSRPYIDYALGHGLPWLLAVGGVVWLTFTKSVQRKRLAYLVPWAIIGSLLLYVPVPWQRKMAEGLHFPICLLAAAAIGLGVGDRLARRLQPRGVEGRLFLISALVVLVSMPSNILFYADTFHNIRTNNADLAHVLMPPIYLQPAEYAAIQELATRGSSRDVILSSSTIGNYIPALTRCRVVAGHWGESVYVRPTAFGHWKREPFESYALPAVLRFFSPHCSLSERAATLLAFNVTYVFCGPAENALFNAARPSREGETLDEVLSTLPFLRKTFAVRDVSLFRVVYSDELISFLHSSSSGATSNASVDIERFADQVR